MPRRARTGSLAARLGRPHCEALEGRVLLTAALDYPLVAADSDAVRRHPEEPTFGPAPRLRQPDLDGDRREDRAELGRSPGASTDTLGVWLGRAEGGQLPALEQALGYVAESLVAEGLDGDGRVDLFAAGAVPDQWTLLPGWGDGTFDGYRRDEPWVTLAVADLTGDGRDDFVYANGPLGRVSVEVAGAGRSVLAQYAEGGTGMFGRNAVQLADLNGDGTLDLIVCNSNGVLVFPGLGGGRFAPEVTGGQGLAAGLGQAQVAFARLGDNPGGPRTAGGHPYLDMVVASEGSSEVLVFSGEGDWGLQLGQRLPVGQAPTSVLPRDVTGDGLTDLVVTAGGDNSVWVLPGLVGGRFDPVAQVLPAGCRPVASYVGDFDRDGRADLVTLDSGSNTLTYYSDVASPARRLRTIDSGGQRPVAALERDVNGDGASDLIVANHDGRLTLFMGGEGGLTPTQTVESPVGHTTALAASTQPGTLWQFYVTGEVAEGAVLMSFEPALANREATPGPPPADESALDPAPARAGRVTILMTALREVEISADEVTLASDLVGAATGVGQGQVVPPGRAGLLTTATAGGQATAEVDASEGDQQEAAVPADPPEVWRFLLGVDEARAPVVGPDGNTLGEVPPAPAPPGGGASGLAPAPSHAPAVEDNPAPPMAPPDRGADAPTGRVEGSGCDEDEAAPEGRKPAWDVGLVLAVGGLARELRLRRSHGRARATGGERRGRG